MPAGLVVEAGHGVAAVAGNGRAIAAFFMNLTSVTAGAPDKI